MKPQKYALAFVLSGALVFVLGEAGGASAPGKNTASHHSGQAAAHMSSSASVNNNAQWSADPARGWVRAEQRHQLSKTSAPAKSAIAKEKQSAKPKAKTR